MILENISIYKNIQPTFSGVQVGYIQNIFHGSPKDGSVSAGGRQILRELSGRWGPGTLGTAGWKTKPMCNMYMYTHTYIYIYMYICICVCICICIYVYACVYVYVYMYMSVYLYMYGGFLK